MKLRTQRVHLMGSSNRDLSSSTARPSELFQKSYAKSHSTHFANTALSLPSVDPKSQKTANPFQGTHFQQQTLRWNPGSKRTGAGAEWALEDAVPALDYSRRLNEGAEDLLVQFGGRGVNMFKLAELKRTFIKNNRHRRNLAGYFQSFAHDKRLSLQAMQHIVGEYGYDITEDEARLIFRLSGSSQEYLSQDQFVELMTKDNVLFRTLKLDGAFGQPRKHFEQRIHLVFRNKFPQIKEAFRIYRMRDEPIDQQRFDYVMKKLDINDLVVSRQERQELFDRFNDHSGFNVERLLCAIVEQEQTHKPTFPPKLSDFEDNLMVNEQKQGKNAKKKAYFDFKRLSNLQYENQLAKAREVLKELNKIPKSQALIFGEAESMGQQALRNRIEGVMQERGVNFSKEEYDCFVSSLDFNTNKQISINHFAQFVHENPKKAEERFERRLRALPPKLKQQALQAANYDEATALESLNKLKSTKFSPEMRVLFREFDQDKDGFVSRDELKQKISSYSLLEHWEVDNLASYFDEGKGYVDFAAFANKFTFGDREPQNPTEPIQKAKSQSEWAATKRSHIKDNNSYVYNVPGKYSAWPQRLKYSDFSLLQPPSRAGQFIPEDSRFASSEKHLVGQQAKQEKARIYQNKLRKLAAWNHLTQERAAESEQRAEQRTQANDYLLRLTKEAYEQRCHQVIS